MVDLGGDWWLGYDGRWRQGLPPPGWRRAHDGNWYPADRMPASDAASAEPSGQDVMSPGPVPGGSAPFGIFRAGAHPPWPDDDRTAIGGLPDEREPADPTASQTVVTGVSAIGRHDSATSGADTTGVTGGMYGTPSADPYGDDDYDDTYGAYSEDDDWDDSRPRHRRAGWLATFASWPAWARVGTPAAAGLIVLAGLVAGGHLLGSHDDTPASATDRPLPSVVSTTTTASTTTSSTTTSTSTTTTTAPTTTSAAPTTAAPQPPPPPPPAARPTATAEPELRYRNCEEAREAGATPLREGDPGYDPAFDLNGNGLACDGGDMRRPGR
jgi:cell division septation protein DedD